MSSNLRAGLILTGGGTRVAYQVGALKALQEILPEELAFFKECIHPLLDLGYSDTMQKQNEIVDFMKDEGVRG